MLFKNIRYRYCVKMELKELNCKTIYHNSILDMEKSYQLISMSCLIRKVIECISIVNSEITTVYKENKKDEITIDDIDSSKLKKNIVYVTITCRPISIPRIQYAFWETFNGYIDNLVITKKKPVLIPLNII